MSFDVDFDVAGYAFINWDNTLEAWWRFEEKGVSVLDWSGHNRHLRTATAGYTTGCFGGSALNCNNTRNAYNYAQLPPTIFERDGEITVAFWTNHTDDANHAFFFNLLSDSATHDGYELLEIWRLAGAASQMKVSATGIGGALTGATSAAFTADGTWQHYAMTLDMATGTVKHYVNGVLEDTDILGALNCGFPATSIVIGGSLYSSSYTINGAMDEVLLFSRVLTATEIAAIYDIAAAGTLAADFVVIEDSTHTYEIVHVSDSGLITKTGEVSLLVNAS